MKKLTDKRRAFQIRKSLWVIRRRAKKKRKVYSQKSKFKSWLQLEAPPMFGIFKERHRAKFLRYLSQVRVSIIENKRPVCLDFSNIEKLEADATLLFVAELRRSTNLSRGVKIRCLPPRKLKIAQVFQKIGVFKVVNHKRRYNPSSDGDVVHWCFATGRSVEGSKYDDILKIYDGKITEKLSNKLYVGITEAMANAHNHAYHLPRGDGFDPDAKVSDWWMFSQEKDGFLTVVFCDLGAGIPKTMPIKHPSAFERLCRVVALKRAMPTDSEIIEEATRLGVSGTRQKHRGRGLSQMVRGIADGFRGNLLLYSNAGCYVVGQKTERKDYGSSIMGTIISWRVPMNTPNEGYHDRFNQHSG